MFDKQNSPVASFVYGGEKIELSLSEMQNIGGGLFEKRLPDGLTAVLEINEISDNAKSCLLYFKNNGKGNSKRISKIRTLDITIPVTGEIVFKSLKGDSCGAESFNPIEKCFELGEKLHIEPCFGRSSDTDGFPFFDLSLGGSAVTCGIGWSGQWMLEMSRSENSFHIETGLAETDTILYPDESIRTVRLLCVKGRNIPSARHNFRKTMFSHFSPKTAAGDFVTLPIAQSSFDRYNGRRADWATVEGQKKCADIAKKCHMDTLWIDAAWFKDGFPNGVGNYTHAEGFSDGLGEIGEYAHKQGLRFLQWFEPERVNCYSETYKSFPDEVIVLDGFGSINCLLNIGEEKVRIRLTELLKKHIREGKLDVYRQDFNMCPSGYWKSADTPERTGMTEIRFVEAHYKIWDAIKAEFPDILIDNCASGGRRIDLETCSRAVPLWRSDTGCSPVSDDKRVHTWSQNHILALTRYIPYHACGIWESETYNMRSVATGGICCDFDIFSYDFDESAIIPIIDEIKNCRKYWYGDFYSLTVPSNSEKIWAAWQLSLGDCGCVTAFRRDECPDSSFKLSLFDIAPDSKYELILTNEYMQKETLILKGSELQALTLHCPKPKMSILAEYKKYFEENQ